MLDEPCGRKLIPLVYTDRHGNAATANVCRRCDRHGAVV